MRGGEVFFTLRRFFQPFPYTPPYFGVNSFVIYSDVPIHIAPEGNVGTNKYQTMFFATRASVTQQPDTKILRTHNSSSLVYSNPVDSTIRMDGLLNVPLFKSGINHITGSGCLIQIGDSRFNQAFLENLSINHLPQQLPTCSLTFKATSPMYFPSGAVGNTWQSAYPPVEGISSKILPEIASLGQWISNDSRYNDTSPVAASLSVNIERSYHYKVGSPEHDIDSFINKLERQVTIDITGISSSANKFIDFSGYDHAGSNFAYEFVSFTGNSFFFTLNTSKTKITTEEWSMNAGDIRNIKHTFLNPVL